MPAAPRPHREAGGRTRRGLTLIELCIALAVLAVLASLALPTMGRQLERHRLQAAAETLQADLAEARFEAVRRRQAVHVGWRSGPAWCWSVTTTPGCGCSGGAEGGPFDPLASPCTLRAQSADDFRGVRLERADAIHFEPDGRASASPEARLVAGGESLHVGVGALGRPRICSPSGAHRAYPRC